MWRRVFNPEGLIWKPLGYLGDILMLSMLWVLGCIPIVTIGASTAALYDTAVHALRRQEGDLIPRFISTYKREAKTAIPSTLLWLAVAGAEILLYRLLAAKLPESPLGNAVVLYYPVLAPFFTLIVFAWVFPTLSRFTFNTLGLNGTALRLALGHILRSAALALLIGGSAVLVLLFGLAVMLLPGLVAWLSTYLIEPVFRPYEPQESEE